MKKIVLLILALCVFAFQACDTSYHEDRLFTYELVYKIHYPTEVVTETFICYSHYNSQEPPYHGPSYTLTTDRKGNANSIYVHGISRKELPSMILDNCVISTTMPLQVVSFKQKN